MTTCRFNACTMCGDDDARPTVVAGSEIFVCDYCAYSLPNNKPPVTTFEEHEENETQQSDYIWRLFAGAGGR